MEHIENGVQSRSLSVTEVRQEVASVFLARIFRWMAIGLGVTGLVAVFIVSSGLARTIATSPLYLFLLLGELVLVFFLAARINKIEPSTATLLYLGYSALNGLTLSVLFLRYSNASIAGTFFITAGMFGAMAIYGLVTKRDLSGMGSFLIMGLFGLIIASVVNIFLHSTQLYWALSVIGVIVFVGLTAYDVQKLKQMGEQGVMEQGEAAIQRGAILGALTLYLDFINLFILLLRFFGGSRD